MKKFFRSFLSLNPTSISFGLTIVVFILFNMNVTFLDLIELKTYDLRFRSKDEIKPSPEIVLAVIDEKSLNEIGKWIWPRSKIAELIDRLSEDGAETIGFDIGFWEPDENSNLRLLNELKDQIKNLKIEDEKLFEFISKNEMEADNDLFLAKSIGKSEADIVLGHFFYTSKYSLNYEVDQEEIDRQLNRIDNSRYPLIRYDPASPDISEFLYQYTAFVPEGNLDVLSDAAESSGCFNMVPDPDGVIRWMPLIWKCGEEVYAPLSVQTAWNYLDRPSLMIQVAEYGIEGIWMGDRFIPTDESGRMLINYLGPEKTFPHYSISDILNRKLPEGTFNNKIVLIGATAIGIYDIRNTPVSSSGEYPGMEVHANVIDNILSQDFLEKPGWAVFYDLLAILLLGLLPGFFLPRISAIKGTLFVLALFIIHLLVCRSLFVSAGMWLNMVYPLLALILTYSSLTLYHYLVEEKNKRFLHATFSSYLSPELIEEMVESENMPELGGEARIITAYFTDIQSFSVFSEKLTAHQLVELLNEYLTAMTDILIHEGGTLDKYEGDAIIAFLGAPMHLPDQTLKACRVAVAMQDALIEVRKKWANEKQLPDEPERNTKNLPANEWAPGDKWPKVVHAMKMRIGVNSGEIVVGNMGSAVRMNYTMMGDPVNLAARLEEGAKQFGMYTAVSDYTLNLEYTDAEGKTRRAMDGVEARFIDNVTVVGKSEPVKVYELCAMKGELTEQEKQLFINFNNGMNHYLKMEWDAAIAEFEKSLKNERFQDGKTTPSEVYIERCKVFKENPPVEPGEKWDGVFRMTEK
jgi:adenylate cyclase